MSHEHCKVCGQRICPFGVAVTCGDDRCIRAWEHHRSRATVSAPIADIETARYDENREELQKRIRLALMERLREQVDQPHPLDRVAIEEAVHAVLVEHAPPVRVPQLVVDIRRDGSNGFIVCVKESSERVIVSEEDPVTST